MNNSKDNQHGSNYAALELFPKKKRRSKFDPPLLRTKKKTKLTPAKTERVPKNVQGTTSDLDNFGDSDSDDVGVGEVVPNIMDKPKTPPTVLHVVRNDLDIIALAYEEIALEGLDGITIEALWTRLQHVTHGPFNQMLKNFIWNKLRNNNSLRLYELPEKRRKLKIFKRFNEEMEEINGAYEVAISQVQDIYSIEATKMEGTFGACDSISTRTDITKKVLLFTLKEIEVCYGNKMVIVADDKLRALKLFTEFNDPTIVDVYSELQYRILERIGRSRFNGEITCGKSSIASLCKDSRSLFYYRRAMEKANIIVSQPISFGVEGQTQTGSLLQLQRFYKEKKIKKHRVIDFLVNLLKTQPQYMIAYSEFLRRIGQDQWLKLKGKTIMKSPEIHTIVNRMTLPYRTVYPNAKPKHWKKKAKNEERSIWVLQLKDPNINLQRFFSKDEPTSDGSSDEDDMKPMSINSCLSTIAYNIVYEAGPEGISFKNFIKASGIDYYSSRRLLLSLAQRKMLIVTKKDVGSQRLKNYVAAHFSHENPNKKVVVQRMAQAEECDDSTIDFIANVLRIDSDNKHYLKEASNSAICNTETAVCEVRPIKLTRSKTNMPADCCKDVYENKHTFEKLISTQCEFFIELPRPSVTMDSNIRDLFGKTFQTESTLNDSTAYLNDFVVDAKLDTSFTMPAERTKCNTISYYNVKEISEFYPILERQNLLLHKGTKQSSYKLILNKTIKMVNKMVAVKDCEHYISSLSSDEEDLDLVDNFSMIVNFDTISELDKDSVDTSDIDAIKAIIINHFEIEDVTISTYVPNIENKTGEKRSHDALEDDCLNIAKRVKRDPNVNETLDSDISSEGKVDDKKQTLQSFIDMGPSPEISQLSKYTECGVKVILSTVPEKYANPVDAFTAPGLTERVIERSNIIVEFIRINNIVTDTKLLNHVRAIEKLRGHETSLDKKTLFRIITRIINFGYIRAVKLFFKIKKFCRSKMMFFVPNYSIFPYLNSVIDAAIFSLRTYVKRKMNLLKSVPNTTMYTPLPSKHIPSNPNYKSSRTISYRYGYLQKFSRLQLMHQFMYYLIYDYSGVSKRERADLATYFDDEESFQQLPEVYKNELTWKMFIPPLPQYPDYPKGWTYIADVVMRLPLSIFVRVCSIVYVIPELSDYLNHPVKRHMLVKDLPLCIVDAMYCNRRYIDIISPLFCYLCYMGILQCGPKYIRSKFDMYVYCNRRAIIYDTTSSDPGYHEVSVRKYEQIPFYFNSDDDITKFWSMIWSISARSKLGYRYSVLGKLITLQNIHDKQSMIETLTPVTPYTAAELDVGYIPGDQRGACGYDSALWIHIRRNWTTPNDKAFKFKDLALSADPKQQTVTKENADIKSTNIHQNRTRKLTTKQRSVKRKRKLLAEPNLGKKKVKIIRRVVKPRPEGPAKVLDDIDKELKETYSGTRARFNRTEMLALSVCLEVLKFMKSARQSISMICIRDFMHRVCKNVQYKKTSSAYRRRLLYIENSVRDLCSSGESPYLKDLNADTFAQKYYTLFIRRVESKKVSEAEIRVAFLYLAYFTMQNYEVEKPNDDFKNYLNIATVQNVELLEQKLYSNATYVKPSTRDDIKRDTLQSLIHSSLSCVINDDNWRLVLLKAFRIYSEDTVRFSVKNMQMLQILSSQKGMPNRQYIDGVLVLMGKSYQLSFAYCFNQITNYPNNIFQNAAETASSVTKEMEKATTRLSIESYENTDLLALFEISSLTTLSYELEQTSDILTINPLISDHTVLIKELVRRCGIIVRNIILQSVTSKEKSNFSIENVENIISKLINSDSTQSLEGVQLIQNIVESSQYLDKDADDDNTFPTYDDSKPIEKSIQPSSEVDSNESRNMSIYGLKSLLTKGLFPELDDDEKLEELENHFTPKYPNVWLVPNWGPDVMAACQPSAKLSDIIDDIERDAVYNFTTTPDNLEVHFAEEDIILVQSLLDFIITKDALGALLSECYDLYMKFSTILSFQSIMEKLINLKYILVHGVTSLTAIHINFIDYWTNPLDSKTSASKYVDRTMDNYRIKLMPWMKVDGTVFVETLENWMCTVLSHCLSYPQSTVQSIIQRFPYMKPVDLYIILKIIQRLDCISLSAYQTTKVTTLFSESTHIDLVPAPYHYAISSLMISVETCAILKLGQALKDVKMI